MLPAVMLMAIMAMPMGYVVGQRFVDNKAKKQQNQKDKDTIKNDYNFLPIMCALILPFGAIMAIMEIIKE
jgi:C4-dicarboxylate transporter